MRTIGKLSKPPYTIRLRQNTYMRRTISTATLCTALILIPLNWIIGYVYYIPPIVGVVVCAKVMWSNRAPVNRICNSLQILIAPLVCCFVSNRLYSNVVLIVAVIITSLRAYKLAPKEIIKYTFKTYKSVSAELVFINEEVRNIDLFQEKLYILSTGDVLVIDGRGYEVYKIQDLSAIKLGGAVAIPNDKEWVSG